VSLLLLDNYDSFVHNLARYAEELGCATRVVRSDAVSIAEIERLAPTAIILSPGPCTPHEAGVCMDVVRELGSRIPMLGVCLGHQAIAAALGGEVRRAPEPVHGRTSLITHDGSGLFAGLPNPLSATRYHSLIVSEQGLPRDLAITARTPDGLIMALAHRAWPVFGVQFHPESILTQAGHQLLANFLRTAGIAATVPSAGDRPKPELQPDFYAQPLDPAAALPLPGRR
jgi:anthranilate synthase/aminodeoxychorismate synthase-like glutamine amidotransferase